MDVSMTETKIELRKLSAADGMVLTDGDIYGKEIYLGIHDSPNNYHEISDEEYAEILKREAQEAKHYDE